MADFCATDMRLLGLKKMFLCPLSVSDLLQSADSSEEQRSDRPLRPPGALL